MSRSGVFRGAGECVVNTRIFTACHVTQLLVIQHLRRHLPSGGAREFLVWYPMEDNPEVERFMSTLVAQAGFAGILDIRDFRLHGPRNHGALAWWFESARRCRADADELRGWLEANKIVEEGLELWADEPIHFNVVFLKSLLRGARQVKYPHSFNLEDASCSDYRTGLERSSVPSAMRRWLYWPWLRLASGCDFRPARLFHFDVGYSFDQPSCWAKTEVDVSNLVTAGAFQETFDSFPAELRAEVECQLAPLRAVEGSRVLLLLFRLSQELAGEFRACLLRVFEERGSELSSCSLAVKLHPGSAGAEEEEFLAWARANLPVEVFPIRSPMNLEFMLRDLNPAFVLAGPCGGLPIVRRLGIGRPVVLPEITEALCRSYPSDRESFLALVRGLEAW